MTTNAKIFLAEERGLHESDWFRTYHSFNFGTYHSEHKQPFENLYLLNDDTLAANKTLHMNVAETSLIILLPVVGTLSCTGCNGNNLFIEPGSVYCDIITGEGSFTITNPHEEALINFLQLWIKLPDSSSALSTGKYMFDIDACKNRLSPVEGLQPVLHIGKFDGRTKATYNMQHTNAALFAFVIEGAFELEEILLHARDGLALQGHHQLEMEALSNGAIILLIEL